MLGENSSSSCSLGASAKTMLAFLGDARNKNNVVNIKRGHISKLAYRVSSSGPTLAADYPVVISFRVKVFHIC